MSTGVRFVSDPEAMTVVVVAGVLKELLRSDSDNSEEDERNLFFLFSISNSVDVYYC